MCYTPTMNSNTSTSQIREIILYQASKLTVNDPVVILPNRKNNNLLVWRFLGVLLILVSISALSLNFGPLLVKELQFRFNQAQKEAIRISENKPEIEPAIKFADLLGKSVFESVETPENPQFSVVIPKIDINENVIAEVDPKKPAEFLKALKSGVALAAGSAYPGQGGTIYIFAHSALYQWDITKFNAVFYQLKDLQIGDEINVFYNNRRYFYKVFETKIVRPDEVSILLENKGERLILQTCWPLGSTKERLLIIAMPVSNSLSYNLTD